MQLKVVFASAVFGLRYSTNKYHQNMEDWNNNRYCALQFAMLALDLDIPCIYNINIMSI